MNTALEELLAILSDEDLIRLARRAGNAAKHSLRQLLQDELELRKPKRHDKAA